MPVLFELQGHRGARGLKPENTLPGFEAAFDLGVTAVETDVHLTRDGVPVLIHNACLSEHLCRRIPRMVGPDPATRPAISSLTLDQLRGFIADRNPDRQRFAHQNPGVTLLAALFAEQQGWDPYALPALATLFQFAAAYAGDLGASAGKSKNQRKHAARVRFALELKRVPFRPGLIGDAFDGSGPALLEEKVVEAVRAAGVADRTTVRSFDHRCLRSIRQLEPALTTAVLMGGTAPIAPARLAQEAEAEIYCPDFEFLDEATVQSIQAEGVRVIPWTINDMDDCARLLDWGVDGLTTDYPDRLAELLHRRSIKF